MRRSIMTLLRVALCFACLTAPVRSSGLAGLVPAAVSAAVSARTDPPAEKECRQGKRTKDFGWLLVDYGLSTAKYVFGLFLIPIGLLLVCVGAVVEVAEAVAC